MQKLEYLSTHDTLTSIYNRNFFEQFMEKYDKQIDTSIAIVLCDVDAEAEKTCIKIKIRESIIIFRDGYNSFQ